MSLISFIFVGLFLLTGSFSLISMHSAFRQVRKEEFRDRAIGKKFFYRYFHRISFPQREEEEKGLFFVLLLTQTLTQLCFAGVATLFLWLSLLSPALAILAALLLLLLAFFLGEFFPRLVGTRYPEMTLRYFSFYASIYLLLFFPVTFLMFKISSFFSIPLSYETFEDPSSRAKRELIAMIKDAQVSPSIDPMDNQLFESVIRFRDRIVREVMVPRVDLFSLPHDLPLNEALHKLVDVGYSRIPIYKGTVDNIVGVLMYKDILDKFQEYERSKDRSIVTAPLSSLQKPALYTHETKKISVLLQEFRKKQTHIAIVVDEYGGTQGIVTIEDILEEIVGEISDEYDEDEELFKKHADGSWIVDARLTINDAEQQLEIRIPQEAEYDSVGGFVFHCAGNIPNKGFRIHRDEFEIEVLSSNERCVEKVRIRPLPIPLED